MIGGATAKGRGPATATFCARTVATRTGFRDGTEIAGLTGVFAEAANDRFASVLWAPFTRRCLRRAGAVVLKPVAANRCTAKTQVRMRDALDRSGLVIGCYTFTISVRTGRIVGQSRCCNIRPEQSTT
jgi:hypothetical protein